MQGCFDTIRNARVGSRDMQQVSRLNIWASKLEIFRVVFHKSHIMQSFAFTLAWVANTDAFVKTKQL